MLENKCVRPGPTIISSEFSRSCNPPANLKHYQTYLIVTIDNTADCRTHKSRMDLVHWYMSSLYFQFTCISTLLVHSFINSTISLLFFRDFVQPWVQHFSVLYYIKSFLLYMNVGWRYQLDSWFTLVFITQLNVLLLKLRLAG